MLNSRVLKKLPIFLAIPLALPALAPGAARAADAADSPIVVTATGAELPAEQSGQSITVLDATAIRTIQGPDLVRVLERVPGVALARSGGLGAQTGLFVRGADSDQVLVLIDGVRMADLASPGGNYDLGNLLAGSIGRIELFRGSNSVIWGSQAIGGVLAIETRSVDGAEASAEYGAHNTTYLTAAAGLQREAAGFQVDAGYANSDGISAKAAGTEPDGYRQWYVDGKAHVRLAPALTLTVNGRHADSRLGLDLTGPDAPDLQFTKEDSARAALRYAVPGLTLETGFALGSVRRHYETGFGPSDYSGAFNRIDLTGHARLAGPLALDFGADSEWTRSVDTFDPRQTARLSSGHALLGWYTPAASLAAGVRVDGHSRFGTHTTFGANGAIRLVGPLRLRASYGEGFKAPTLYQLYGSFVGNASLQPGTAKSYEAGVDWGDVDGAFHAAATVFRRDSRNLIDFDPNANGGFGAYGNIARARAEGVELEAAARSGPVVARALYAWVKSRDLVRDRDLARRPRHTATIAVDWTTPLKVDLGVDLRVAGSASDYDDFALTTTRLAPWATVTLRASVPVTSRLEAFGRIENLADKRYQTVAGYNTMGRVATVGIRGRL
ncbi:MAG: TonB-dependent receptor [Sphingomonadales bacterium]|nr:TonB-dependent receptor [Sphingomonadales bacterium]